jgi:hypothetical protein
VRTEMTPSDVRKIIEALDRIDRKLVDLEAAATMRMRLEVAGWDSPIESLRRLGASAADIARWTGRPITSVAPTVSRAKARERRKAKR